MHRVQHAEFVVACLIGTLDSAPVGIAGHHRGKYEAVAWVCQHIRLVLFDVLVLVNLSCSPPYCSISGCIQLEIPEVFFIEPGQHTGQLVMDLFRELLLGVPHATSTIVSIPDKVGLYTGQLRQLVTH